MASSQPPQREADRARPLIVDLVRVYEGLLFGVVLVVLALVVTGGTLGPAELGALIVVPPIAMVLFMRRGAPRTLFRLRATAALLGWAVAWILFPPLFVASYLVGRPLGGEYAVFTLLAMLDGLVVGLVLGGVDRLAPRLRTRPPPEGG